MDDGRAAWRTFETPIETLPGPGTIEAGEAPLRPSQAHERNVADRLRDAAPGLVPLALAAATGAVIAAAFALVLGGPGSGAVVIDAGASGAADATGTGPGLSGSVIGASPEADRGTTGAIVVDVEGGVARPGVVRLAAGARVGDAVAAAGGYGPGIDAARAAVEINLAARLQDGDRVRVPAVGDPAASPGAGAAAGAPGLTAPPAGGASGDAAGGATGGALGPAGAPVDLNHASAAELDTLPGIGPATAARIIEARGATPFARVSDLRDRKVVSASTYAKIEALVTVLP